MKVQNMQQLYLKVQIPVMQFAIEHYTAWSEILIEFSLVFLGQEFVLSQLQQRPS